MCSSARAAARKISRRNLRVGLAAHHDARHLGEPPDQGGGPLDHPPAHAAAADERAVDVPEDQSAHTGAPGTAEGKRNCSPRWNNTM